MKNINGIRLVIRKPFRDIRKSDFLAEIFLDENKIGYITNQDNCLKCSYDSVEYQKTSQLPTP